MGFLPQAGAATALITLTLAMQSAGMAVLVNWGLARFARDTYRLSPVGATGLMVRFTVAMIALHFLQILLWAGFYRWHCFPSWEAAFYFSTASYSTVGYGDVLFPRKWRILGPLESVTGVLMCGLSASLLFAIVTRLVEREEQFRTSGNRLRKRAYSVPHNLHAERREAHDDIYREHPARSILRSAD